MRAIHDTLLTLRQIGEHAVNTGDDPHARLMRIHQMVNSELGQHGWGEVQPASDMPNRTHQQPPNIGVEDRKPGEAYPGATSGPVGPTGGGVVVGASASGVPIPPPLDPNAPPGQLAGNVEERLNPAGYAPPPSVAPGGTAPAPAPPVEAPSSPDQPPSIGATAPPIEPEQPDGQPSTEGGPGADHAKQV